MRAEGGNRNPTPRPSGSLLLLTLAYLAAVVPEEDVPELVDPEWEALSLWGKLQEPEIGAVCSEAG